MYITSVVKVGGGGGEGSDGERERERGEGKREGKGDQGREGGMERVKVTDSGFLILHTCHSFNRSYTLEL